MTAKQHDKLIDWIANEVSLAMAGAWMRGDLKLTIFPEGKRPDYDCARKIAKKLKLVRPEESDVDPSDFPLSEQKRAFRNAQP